MERSLFDRMHEAWAAAKVEEKQPARWRLNIAAWHELLKDERFYKFEAPRDPTKIRLLGVPLTILDDRQTVPSFYLNTESLA